MTKLHLSDELTRRARVAAAVLEMDANQAEQSLCLGGVLMLEQAASIKRAGREWVELVDGEGCEPAPSYPLWREWDSEAVGGQHV